MLYSFRNHAILRQIIFKVKWMMKHWNYSYNNQHLRAKRKKCVKPVIVRMILTVLSVLKIMNTQPA